MDVVVLNQSRQSITCQVTVAMRFSFVFTAVYASNVRVDRAALWSELVDLYQNLNLENQSWLVEGDLNQITHFSEHSNPSWDHLTPEMIELKDVFTTIGIEDLRFQGFFHT